MSGFDYFDAELQAFSKEIDRIEQDRDQVYSRRGEPGFNLTHESLRHRVRANFVAASLVSLVEYRLYDIARELVPKFDAKKVAHWEKLLECLASPTCHSTGAGLSRGRDVTQLPSWPRFDALRSIRHPVVHGFGDIALASTEEKARNAIKLLQLEKILVGDRRISFTVPALRVALDVVRTLMGEIDAQDKATT